ncbi:MAG: ATP-binding protein [Candidatus Omnitrophota bacterium]
MHIFAFSSISVSVSTGLITIFVLWKGRNRSIDYIWAFLCCFVCIWGLAGYKISTVDSKSIAFFWWQMAHVGIIFIPISYYHFSYAFVESKNIFQKYILYGSYALGSIFLLLTFFAPRGVFLGDLRLVFNQFYTHDWRSYRSILYLLFYIGFYWGLLLYSFSLLINKYRSSRGILKNQLRYLLVASVIGWIGAHGYYLVVFGIDIYPHSNFLIALYPVIIAYAIIKHQLMDVRVALTRGAILLMVYFLIVAIPAFFIVFGKEWLVGLFADKWFWPPLGLYTVLALFAPYIYVQLQDKAEAKRMMQQYHLHQSLKAASKTTIEVQSIDKLSRIIPRYILRLYSRMNNKIMHITLFLKVKGNHSYALKSSVGPHKLPSDLTIEEHSYLVRWFTKIRDVLVERGVLKEKDVEVLVYEDIDYWMGQSKIMRVPFRGLDKVLKNLKKIMKDLKAQIILPSVYQKELLGFLILGEKTPDLYSRSDIDTFSILANDSAMAFKAAQLFEDLKIAQARMIQSEKLSLLGQLASSMAHEINNPLAIISGNVQLLLMDVKDEKFVDLLKKIEGQTERGYKIIHRLLNFSRLPKEDIKDIDMGHLIDETLELVAHKIRHGNIIIEKDFLETKPIKGNPTQIQEVLLNLFVNAIQAMPEGGSLKIATTQLEKHVQVTVTDTGKGIAPEDLKNIFDPFFTKGKENGTGLGLFVTDQVMKLHKGDVKITSKVGVGTTFILKFGNEL